MEGDVVDAEPAAATTRTTVAPGEAYHKMCLLVKKQ